MEIEEIRLAIDAFKFDSSEEKIAFEKEIQELIQAAPFQGVIRRNLLATQYNLYLTISGEETDLLIAFGDVHNNKLLQYLSNFTSQELALPKQVMALEVFLHTCTKQLDEYYLDVILEKELLDFYPPHALQIIRQFTAENMYTLVDIGKRRWFPKYRLFETF